MRDMYALTGENESKKAGKIVIALQTLLESSRTPDEYLIDICRVLINQQHQILTDIATTILQELGECECVCEIIILGDHESHVACS